MTHTCLCSTKLFWVTQRKWAAPFILKTGSGSKLRSGETRGQPLRGRATWFLLGGLLSLGEGYMVHLNYPTRFTLELEKMGEGTIHTHTKSFSYLAHSEVDASLTGVMIRKI